MFPCLLTEEVARESPTVLIGVVEPIKPLRAVGPWHAHTNWQAQSMRKSVKLNLAGSGGLIVFGRCPR